MTEIFTFAFPDENKNAFNSNDEYFLRTMLRTRMTKTIRDYRWVTVFDDNSPSFESVLRQIQAYGRQALKGHTEHHLSMYASLWQTNEEGLLKN